MTTEIIGSKEKSQTSRGQNQDLTPVSARKTLEPIPNVGIANPTVPGLDPQDVLAHRLAGGEQQAARDGMKSPGDGGVIPVHTLGGPTAKPVQRPIVPGNLKR